MKYRILNIVDQEVGTEQVQHQIDDEILAAAFGAPPRLRVARAHSRNVEIPPPSRGGVPIIVLVRTQAVRLKRRLHAEKAEGFGQRLG